MDPDETQADQQAVKKAAPRWSAWKTFIIGRQDNPMMKRLRIVQTPWLGVYVHFIYREDLDADPHDHPWNFARIVLRGGYSEEYHGSVVGAHGRLRPFRPGYVRTDAFHRITSVEPGTVSLIVVGPKHRTWGFWVPGKVGQGDVRRFVPWRQYLGLDDTSAPG